MQRFYAIYLCVFKKTKCVGKILLWNSKRLLRKLQKNLRGLLFCRTLYIVTPLLTGGRSGYSARAGLKSQSECRNGSDLHGDGLCWSLLRWWGVPEGLTLRPLTAAVPTPTAPPATPVSEWSEARVSRDAVVFIAPIRRWNRVGLWTYIYVMIIIILIIYRNSHLHASRHWNSRYLAPPGSWAGLGTWKAEYHNHRRLQRDRLPVPAVIGGFAKGELTRSRFRTCSQPTCLLQTSYLIFLNFSV